MQSSEISIRLFGRALRQKECISLQIKRFEESIKICLKGIQQNNDDIQFLLKKQTEFEEKLNELNSKIDGLGLRMDKIEQRMDKIEQRMENVETKLRCNYQHSSK
ncbi:hypothetical protein GVN20_08995 [Runella sp. CRIBMP]|uniref:hypothetical protein n=1 Tax=Runella sp. CRIBMP TaxID=2683261 RepID=UPI0014135E04|nr:hypothetical protein [Runella sp. CRIBMP]NBB19485.1 hypothetical protein [Runella sp. CRIBMP]